MTIGLLEILEILRDRDHSNTGACVFEVTELISEVSIDLQGHLKVQNGQKLNTNIVAQNIKSQTPSGYVA